METHVIVAAIESEIARLQQAKALLTGTTVKRGPGRPAGVAPKKRKGGMSAEGRKRIAEAQRKRWAAIKTKK